ncbi:MAG: ROK family protein [Chloroflexi bacterium]|nr:ROK family protein [Chloroflexota bacterium]
MHVLGLDIGGTGIKGALVETGTGVLITERFRLRTPEKAEPGPVMETIRKVVEHFAWNGSVGCGFPAVIKHGVAYTAANISDRWIGFDVRQALVDATGCPATVINDADAAGIAEMRFGAGMGEAGTVLVLTLGTGIGTALFVRGQLVPNMELGHIEVNGREAEPWTADIARKRERLSWKKWGRRLNIYLQALERLVSPDLIIIGGGASREHEKFFPCLDLETRVVPAAMLNEAGIIGAALAATGL